MNVLIVGSDPDRITDLLAPIEARWQHRTTPAAWKRERARERLDDGATLTDAIVRTQRDYLGNARKHDSFTDWLAASKPRSPSRGWFRKATTSHCST